MREIYQKASKVLVFLGKEEDNSDSGFELVEKLATDFQAVYHAEQKQPIFPNQYESFGLPAPYDEAWDALRSILRRPWFRRVWVVQEFATAKKVVIICGRVCMGWETFGTAIQQCQNYKIGLTNSNYDHTLAEATAGGEQAMYWLTIAATLFREDPPPLLWVLQNFRHTFATRARDHLFALLGLTRDFDNAAFDPNYDESFDLIVRRYAAEFVSGGQGVTLIALARLNVNLNRFLSWIPDWTSENTIRYTPLNSLITQFGEKILKLYHASGASKPQMWVDIDPNILVVRGSLVDIVTKVGQSHPEHRGLPVHSVFDRLQESDEIVAILEIYLNGEDISEAHWRTLIRNRTRDNVEAPLAYGTRYRLMRNRIEMAHQQIPGTLANTEEWPYLEVVLKTFEATRFCVTEKGYIGLCAEGTRPGDNICILLGGIAPVVLRKSDTREHHFRLVGECNIHGIMKGEAFESKDFNVTDMSLW
jgi:hypothetical protein